jgi:copper oxidase (laccase) domain-containing protein
MGQEFCSRPENLLAVIGPSIGPDSFQVGEEVAEKFKEAGFPMDEIWSFRGPGDGSPMSGGHHIDLWKANRWLLERLGIPPESIQIVGIDTFTTPSLFSARREGVACGRIINSIMLK